jgi:hypothetical protein
MTSILINLCAIPSMFRDNGVKSPGEMTNLPLWVPPIFFLLRSPFSCSRPSPSARAAAGHSDLPPHPHLRRRAKEAPPASSFSAAGLQSRRLLCGTPAGTATRRSRIEGDGGRLGEVRQGAKRPALHPLPARHHHGRPL